MTDFRKYTAYPLGIRNNNPGNLRYVSSIHWKGQVGSNKGFAVFDTVENGIRAMAIDLKTKIGKGLDTLNKYIPVYAPPSENDTVAYINNVSRQTGISPNDKITFNNEAVKLIRAHINIENGGSGSLITDTMILSGLSLIGGSFTTAKNLAAVLIVLLIISGVLFLIFKQ